MSLSSVLGELKQGKQCARPNPCILALQLLLGLFSCMYTARLTAPADSSRRTNSGPSWSSQGLGSTTHQLRAQFILRDLSLNCTHHWLVPQAGVEEEAVQVSVLHEGEDDHGRWEAFPFRALEADA